MARAALKCSGLTLTLTQPTFMMSEGTAGQPSRRMYSSTSTTACFTCDDSLTAQRRA